MRQRKGRTGRGPVRRVTVLGSAGRFDDGEAGGRQRRLDGRLGRHPDEGLRERFLRQDGRRQGHGRRHRHGRHGRHPERRLQRRQHPDHRDRGVPPLNHLLLTVTNTGSKNCDLTGYPIARFGEAQSVPPVAEQTHPQAVVTLAPGESGYAGVLLSAGDGSGGNGYTAKTLVVGFAKGATSTPALPAKGVYVDDKLTVTYWQQSLDDALSY